MKTTFTNLCFLLLGTLLAFTSFAQTSVTVSGNVKNSTNNETVPAVSIIIKGTGEGTYTDERGNFKITTTRRLPFTLVFSSIGFAAKDVVVSSASQFVGVTFDPVVALGQEVVVSATRTPQRILESPVSIERMSAANIANSAVPDFYEGMKN